MAASLAFEGGQGAGLGVVCSPLGWGGASTKPHTKQGPADPQKSMEWYQMDANEAKWDAASNEAVLGWSTMPGWVLGSYSKHSSAAFMREHGKPPPTQPRSSQKTHTIRQPKSIRCNERNRYEPGRGGRQDGG